MRNSIVLFFLSLSSLLFGQEAKLAESYFQNAEYEKAAVLYEKLNNEFPDNEVFLNNLLESLYAQDMFDKVQEILEKRIKKKPKELSLYVNYGNLLEKKGNQSAADAQYQKAIQMLTDDGGINTCFNLYNAFKKISKSEFALQALEKTVGFNKKHKPILAYQFAETYSQLGNKPKMIESYLDMAQDPAVDQSAYLKSVFQRILSSEDYDELENQLFIKVQEVPNNITFPELLSWLYIQKKDFKSAFVQTKAIDNQMNENGYRVYNLGNIAYNEKDYDAAISCYEYILTKGKSNAMYVIAKRNALRCRKEKLTAGFAYTKEDVRVLEQYYESFIKEYDNPSALSELTLDLADLEAFYINDLPKATSTLNALIETPGVPRPILANAKLKLGDVYLIQGERWESTLLYSQVDKEFKEDTLGHEARYRNAKLSYYFGDFEWAQSQFGVLKTSTSKLISNDAIDMSVFITDNVGLDTSEAAMEMYATAELFVFQNKFEEAFSKLDSLVKVFPKHSLEDDILWLKAQVLVKKRKYEESVPLLEKIFTDFKEDIRADNALYTLAGLYAHPQQLNNPEKAKVLYEKLFTDFSNSTLAVDARKQYRLLRGDKVQ